MGAGGATVDVDRAGAVNTANTVLLGTLNIGAQTLTTTGANGYGVRFSSATLTGDATINATTANTTLGGAVGGGFALTKTGAGTLTLLGTQNYAALNANGGVTELNSALGTGGSVIHANATLHISTSQTLASLTIANGVEVTFGNGLASPFAGEPEKFGAPALVPEPGSAALLLIGALGFLSRRRRD